MDGGKTNINLLVHPFLSIFYAPGIKLTPGNLESDERDRQKHKNLQESRTNATRMAFKGLRWSREQQHLPNAARRVRKGFPEVVTGG